MNTSTESQYTPHQLILTHTVGADMAGERLDAFLKALYRKRSRESLKEAIFEGRVTLVRPQSPHLSAGKAKPSTVLLEGDVVRIVVVRRAEPAVNLDYRVVYEDEVLLVVDKPAGLPVHPAGSYFFNTLLVHLRTRGYRDSLDSGREYFLAHRIDRETSGLLLLAKNAVACEALTEQFRNRVTRKRYLAVVHGRVEADTFAVNAPIGKDQGSRVKLKMAVVPEGEGGLTALTECRVLRREAGYSLVECLPKTGRQHQIRVHLASAGHPLVGDKLYSISDEEASRFYDQPFRLAIRPTRDSLTHTSGDGLNEPPVYAPRFVSPEVRAKLVLDRHALHNAGIGFQHPTTREDLWFESPLPQELERLFS
ncbi:MAG: RluA family pseudouridine synthase [Bdellovibrionales bacterium]|nr:RluA family pseudouridine synthase [Bdellovibrionales bacterium]